MLSCLPGICEALGSVFNIERFATKEKSYFWQLSAGRSVRDIRRRSILQPIQPYFRLGKKYLERS